MSNLESSKPGRGRPVNPQLREDIIHTAGDLFSELGLHATTMEQIATKLKISKLTLYSRFKDKEALFAAVVQNKCREFVPDQMFTEFDANDAVSSLNQICFSLMKLLVSDDAQGMERMLMALDSGERAKLTRLFYQEGPQRVVTLIERHLIQLHNRNALTVTDPAVSANLLAAMVKGSDICTRKQMHVEPAPTETEMKRYCNAVVNVFIKGLS